MNKSSNRMNSYPLGEIVTLAQEFFLMGKKVKLVARGNSMRPMLADLRDEIVLAPYGGEQLNKGDVALFCRKNGSYVMHRIVSCNPDGTFDFLGDSQLTRENGITADSIVAVAVGYVIKGREYTEDSLKCRFFSRFWVDTVFWRKVYLKLFARFWRKSTK